MSVYRELVRLGALYIAALTDPYSCPRDRQILLAKITDLEEEANRLKVRAARVAETSEAEVERLKKAMMLRKLRGVIKHEPLGEDHPWRLLEIWRQEQEEREGDDIRLWEAEHQY